MGDLFLNPARAPSLEDFGAAMKTPAAELWLEINAFIQKNFKAKPKIEYSPCQGKPGWNVKYKKSGKALCTLYPEPECLTALVVIDPLLAAGLDDSDITVHPWIIDLIHRTKLYLGKLWLMIPITDQDMLESLKRLLVMKSGFSKS